MTMTRNVLIGVNALMTFAVGPNFSDTKILLLSCVWVSVVAMRSIPERAAAFRKLSFDGTSLLCAGYVHFLLIIATAKILAAQIKANLWHLLALFLLWRLFLL